VADNPLDNPLDNPCPVTPEQVVGAMSIADVQELLGELGMADDVSTSRRFQLLVAEYGRFELAIESIGGAATMRRAA
jgi:hypothetical protein